MHCFSNCQPWLVLSSAPWLLISPLVQESAQGGEENTMRFTSTEVVYGVTGTDVTG